MSAILNIDSKEIVLTEEPFSQSRSFSKAPNVCFNNVTKLVTLECSLCKKLPNRKSNYRNHYCLYYSDNRLVLVYIETMLDFGMDNDAITKYITFTFNDTSHVQSGNWTISYDSVTTDFTAPSDLEDFVLHSYGEWWSFNKGFILNGIVGYQGTAISYKFIYLELLSTNTTQIKPKTMLTNTEQLYPFVNIGNSNITNKPETMQEKQEEFKVQNLIPTRLWFYTRERELDNGDIKYFIPIS